MKWFNLHRQTETWQQIEIKHKLDMPTFKAVLVKSKDSDVLSFFSYFYNRSIYLLRVPCHVPYVIDLQLGG